MKKCVLVVQRLPSQTSGTDTVSVERMRTEDDTQYGDFSTGDEIQVRGDEFRIGRRGTQHLLLARARNVSSNHAVIVRRGENFTFVDTSRNGSKINERLLDDESQALSDGDTITLPGKSGQPIQFVATVKITDAEEESTGETSTDVTSQTKAD